MLVDNLENGGKQAQLSLLLLRDRLMANFQHIHQSTRWLDGILLDFSSSLKAQPQLHYIHTPQEQMHKNQFQHQYPLWLKLEMIPKALIVSSLSENRIISFYRRFCQSCRKVPFINPNF